MSYKQKCLAVDPGLRCKASFGLRYSRPEFYAVWRGGYIIGEGWSAATAWKAAWGELNEKEK